MTAIDEIKARLDIVDIVSESVELKRSGRSYSGFCPFHHNTRTPAFAVFPETGTWRCFGECNEGGDIFSFVMKKEGWDFPTALAELAQRAGVTLRPLTPQEQEKVEEYDRLRELLENAVTFFQHQLLNTPAGGKARDYIYQRGLNDDTIANFGLGYAPNSWEAATRHLKDKGFSEADMLSAGLVSERDSGGVYDRFRHRVMLPIRDERGRMCGFGARALSAEDMPKYLNSPQTPIFDKGKILFGLDQARRAIREHDQVVIVEGYMGVLSPHQAGYPNVVATMGTALTEDHLRLLKRFTRRMIMAMDSDAAGMKATLRGLEVARQTLDREGEVRFDARGLLRQEGRLKADIRVSTLPKGMDPDDIINDDPDEWQRIITAAKPIVVHVMDTLAASRDLEDPKTKSEIAGQVLPLIEDIPDAIERDAYRQQLARLLKVDERTLTPRGARRPPRRRYQPRRSPQHSQPAAEALTKVATPQTAIHAREVHILGVLLRRPELIYHIDRYLQEHGLPRIDHEDFQHSDLQIIFGLAQNALKQNETEPLNYVLNHLPTDMMPLADAILENTQRFEAFIKDELKEVLRALVQLRQQKVSQNVIHLDFLIQSAYEQEQVIDREYIGLNVQQAQFKDQLDYALADLTNFSPTL